MENESPQQNIPIQQPSQAPPPVENSNRRFWKTLGIGLSIVSFCIAIAIGGYLLGSNKNVPTQQISDASLPSTSTIAESWTKPKSIQKGYPIVKFTPTDQQPKRNLYIYSFSTKSLRNTNLLLGGSGRDTIHGRLDAVPSPDMLYTAYVDSNYTLWILSNETLQAQQVTQTKGTNIIGWTPNSKKLLYNIDKSTILTSTHGMGSGPTGVINFDKNDAGGVFVFDIYSGAMQKLSPINDTNEIIEIIDNSRLLTNVDSTGGKLIVFNFDTFQADYGFVKEEFGFGADQHTFSADGKKWAYTLSRNPTTDANIIYADFPNKEGLVIESGEWAYVQRPIISQDGFRVVYAKREGLTQIGIPRNFTYLYDATTKIKKQLIEGNPLKWADSSTIIITRPNAEDGSADALEYYLVDIKTGSSTKMN